MDVPDKSDAIPRSIGRVLDLLEFVLETGECNLTAAASAAELTPTTALRYLRALEARGFIYRDQAGQFSAGARMMRIAAALRDDSGITRFVALGQPHLERLAAVTGESAYMSASDGEVATYVATAESNRAIRHVGWVGRRVPLEGTAVGEALSNPGIPFHRHEAVEPDITAICQALPPIGKLGIALSIIGPQHRLDAAAIGQAESALGIAVNGLLHDMGFATTDNVGIS